MHPYWEGGKNHVLCIMHFSHPRWEETPVHMLWELSTTPKVYSLHLASRPLAWQDLQQTQLNLHDSRLSLTVGSSGSIWAPWSLISIFCNASGISTFLCSVFSVLHSARHSLCLVFGSGSSEAGGNCTLQLTRVTWLLLTRAAGQVLHWMPWIPGPVREISWALYHCPHLATGIKCSLQCRKSNVH